MRWRRWFVGVALLLASPALLGDDCGSGKCDIWEEIWLGYPDMSSALLVGQTTASGSNGEQGGWPIGQTFRVDQTISRIDVLMTSKGDLRPLTFSLWEWADTNGNCEFDEIEYPTTRGGSVWQDTITLPGKVDDHLVALRPTLAATSTCTSAGHPYEGSSMYYMEFRGDLSCAEPCLVPGEWGVRFTQTSTSDPYPGGFVRVNNVFRPGPPAIDMWFKIYGPSSADVVLPDFVASTVPNWNDVIPDPQAQIGIDDFRGVISDAVGPSRDCGSWTYSGQPLTCAAALAFLHATGGEDLADSVYYEFNALTYDEDPGVSFTFMETAAWAYKWVEADLAEWQRSYMKRLLLDRAAHFWANRELGTHNRAMGGALTYYLVTDLVSSVEMEALNTYYFIPDCVTGDPPGVPVQLCPECDPASAEYDCEACKTRIGEDDMTGRPLCESDHAVWRTYAGQVWGEFTDNWENQEDSSHYDSLGTRMILQIDDVVAPDGTGSIWGQPGFLDFVERAYQKQTPLGPVAVYGDSRGVNHDWGTRTFLFTRAWRKLQDPRYESAAFRTFDYHRRHILDRELAESVYEDWITYPLAYFDLYDPVAPAVLTDATLAPRSEWLDAAQTVSGTTLLPRSKTVGQVFEMNDSPLVRLELMIDPSNSPPQLSIYEWTGNYASTTGADPLFQETLDTSGGMQNVTVYPYIDRPASTSYFVEIRANGKFKLASSTTDVYAAGTAYRGSTPQANRDLYFQAHTLTKNGSVVTQRPAVHPLRSSQQYVDGPRRIATTVPSTPLNDKLVLRSGYDPKDFHVVVNLLAANYSHGHAETGALIHVSDEGSLILGGVERADKHMKYNSVAIGKRHTGGTTLPLFELIPASPVTGFRDYRSATVATLQWGDPWGWSIDHERRFFFVKNRFLVVRDSSLFHEDMFATTGILWRSHDVHPTFGDNWAHLFDRNPQSLTRVGDFKNPERYALLYVADDTDTISQFPREEAMYKDTYVGNPPSGPFAVSQRTEENFTAGDSVRFDSVLLPHGDPTMPVGSAVQVIPSAEGTLVLQLAVGDEIWIFVDNPGGGDVALPGTGGGTDAGYLLARRNAQGIVDYLLIHDATSFNWSGVDREWGIRSSIEEGGFIGPSPQ